MNIDDKLREAESAARSAARSAESAAVWSARSADCSEKELEYQIKLIKEML